MFIGAALEPKLLARFWHTRLGRRLNRVGWRNIAVTLTDMPSPCPHGTRHTRSAAFS
jgi:hypothetical protein